MSEDLPAEGFLMVWQAVKAITKSAVYMKGEKKIENCTYQ